MHARTIIISRKEREMFEEKQFYRLFETPPRGKSCMGKVHTGLIKPFRKTTRRSVMCIPYHLHGKNIHHIFSFFDLVIDNTDDDKASFYLVPRALCINPHNKHIGVRTMRHTSKPQLTDCYLIGGLVGGGWPLTTNTLTLWWSIWNSWRCWIVSCGTPGHLKHRLKRKIPEE